MFAPLSHLVCCARWIRHNLSLILIGFYEKKCFPGSLSIRLDYERTLALISLRNLLFSQRLHTHDVRGIDTTSLNGHQFKTFFACCYLFKKTSKPLTKTMTNKFSSFHTSFYLTTAYWIHVLFTTYCPRQWRQMYWWS